MCDYNQMVFTGIGLSFCATSITASQLFKNLSIDYFMTVSQTLTFLLLLHSTIAITASPNWLINSNLNAGEVVVVNKANPSTFLPSSTTNLNKTQLFINASFTSTPRVILSMIGYGQFQPATSSAKLGFKIMISSTNLTAFKYNVSTYEVLTPLLHYIYLAIQHETMTFYTSMQYLTFNSTSNLANITAPIRHQLLSLPYPGGQTNPNPSNPQFIIQTFATGFCLIPYSKTSYFSLNATALNSSHYQLNISTISNNSLTELSFSVISFDRGILTSNYTVYIDIILYSVSGNWSLYGGDMFNSSQYMFRNGMTGAVHVQFQLTLVPTNSTYYYYNATSAHDNWIVSRGFNYRVRKCPAGFNYYQPATVLCHDICPSDKYTNSTYLLCMPCHYSCKTCTASNNITACSSCSSADHRTLSSNNSCLCELGYYDSAVKACSLCHYTCLSCSDNPSTCLACNNNLNRQLGNSSCICMAGYYENITCISCSQKSIGCTACSYISSTFQCLNCNSSLFRALDSTNSSCVCIIGYYQNSNNLCILCNLTGCLSCTINPNSNSLVCLICDVSLNWILSKSICQCPSNYILQNSTCILQKVTPAMSIQPIEPIECGNGILESGEECDDHNRFNYDGCSSACAVESSHNCLNNSTLLRQSLCYYNGQITLTPILVYKFPNQNSVKIELKVSAPGCNYNNLRQYLQKTVSLQLIDQTTRRLSSNQTVPVTSKTAWSSVSTKSILFDDTLKLLTILFDYDASIDLSRKNLYLISSNSVENSYVKYFFQTPHTALQLSQPYNGLLTTYYPEQQRQQFVFLTYIFYALVGLNWISFLVSFIFQRAAAATESIIVFQISYLTLVDSQNLMECWGGLQLAGKYTFGYNPPFFVSYFRDDQLAINLQVNAFNNFSIVFSVVLVLWLLILILFYRLSLQERKISQQQMTIEQSSICQNKEANISKLSNQQNKIQSNNPMSMLEQVLRVFIDLYLSISLMLACGLVVSLAFSTSETFLVNIVVGVLFLFINLVFWSLYLKKRNKRYFKAVSFASILRDQKQLSRKCKKFIKFYYFGMFICLAICGGLIVLLRKQGLVLYMIIEVVSVGLIVFLANFDIYKQKIDKIRAILNLLFLSLLIILHILSQQLFTSLGSGFTLVIAAISIFSLQLLVTVTTNVIIIRKIRESQKALQQRKPIKEPGAANLSFLEQIGCRSLHYKQEKENSGRVMMDSGLYDELERSLNNSIGERKVKQLLQQKVSELRDLIKSPKKVIPFSMNQQQHNPSFQNEPQQKYRSESNTKINLIQQSHLKGINEKTGKEFKSTQFNSSFSSMPFSNLDQIIDDMVSCPEKQSQNVEVEITDIVKRPEQANIKSQLKGLEQELEFKADQRHQSFVEEQPI